jgi:hypothetical protein
MDDKRRILASIKTVPVPTQEHDVPTTIGERIIQWLVMGAETEHKGS